MPKAKVTIIRGDQVIAQKVLSFNGAGYVSLPAAVSCWFRGLTDCLPLRRGDITSYEYKED